MINSYLKPGAFQNWGDVPVSTQEEVLAHQAVLTFSADTSLSEKVQRVFNGMMFFIAGVALLNLIPPVAVASSRLSGMGLAFIDGASLLKNPVAVAIMDLAPKMIVMLAILLVVRKVLAVAINCLVYPAVLISYDKQLIDHERWELFETLQGENFECHRIALNKSGIRYDAFTFEHEETKGNDQWVMIAGGNAEVGERRAVSYARKFKERDFNVLYVNGPGVGRSSGYPTSYSIGAGQEAGLQFLETIVKAKKILLYGISLGGGAQAEAIKNHEFKIDDIDYLVWSDRSFDKLSNVASSMVTNLVKPLFFLLGIELDGVAGARKLQQLGITHIVTQNSQIIDKNDVLPLDQNCVDDQDDDVIPNKTSLYVGLKQAGIQDSDRLKCYGGPFINHNGDLPQEIQDLVQQEIEAFLAR